VAPSAGGADAFVAWYETPLTSRADPIQDCAGARGAPLMLALASGVNTTSPSMGAPVMLTAQSTSVRAPAMTALYGTAQTLLAAPDGDAVSVWPLTAGQSAGPPSVISGLSGARSVAMASATDGSGRLAVVAEVGCTPQTIALALGTMAAGFSHVTTVVAPGSGFAIEPTVAWVPSEGYWMVSWIAQAGGGPRAFAQRFDIEGGPVGGPIDPMATALAASITSNGSLFAYEQSPGMNGTFLSVSLGCAK
jgi:hypothetical protein